MTSGKVEECDYCHRVYLRPCHMKIGAYFNCGKVEHLIKDSPMKRKDASKLVK